MDETFSSIELITECLSDTERTSKLKDAIENAVRPGDSVLDVGTGSAILALIAARAGAHHVTAIEFDPYVAQFAKKNISDNKYDSVVNVVLGDARTINLETDRKFDVVIMEMLTTGMVDEHQVWAINNLHQKGLVDEKTKFVPKRQDTFIALSQKNFEVYGFTMRMVRHLWSWLPNNGLEILSDQQLLNSISFDKINDLDFIKTLSFQITKPGIVNSFYLSSKTVLEDNSDLGDTLALNAPVVFPLEEDLVLEKGDILEMEIRYRFGNGYRNLTVKKI